MNATTLFVRATQFRGMAEIAWSERTAYSNQYDSTRPSRGQCGVTSICLGLWLTAQEGLRLEDMAYARGELWAEGERVDPNHSWLEIGADGHLWRADLTADQCRQTFPAVIVEPVQAPYVGLDYRREKSTPLTAYDTAKMRPRLAAMAGILGIDLSPLAGAQT